jgi:chorismate-pyruvate lyase
MSETNPEDGAEKDKDEGLPEGVAPMDVQTAHDILQPLTDFYADRPLPEIHWLEGEQLPRPYRDLLFHESDMTTTLENFHGSSIYLQVLKRELSHQVLSRQVILALDNESQLPVEFGAIRIYLAGLDPDSQRLVLEGLRPLGGILNGHEVDYISSPSGFFALEADDLMREAFLLEQGGKLYGRCNTLTHRSGDPLAEVVEILPPTSGR